jgi:heterodisulfide reductase subunit B/ferredoxin
MGEEPVFWGCTIAHTLPYLIKTSNAVLDGISVKTREIDGWSCCPDPVSAKAYSHDAALALSARNMALAGKHMVVACSGCFNTFEKARKELEYPEASERVNRILPEGEKYLSSVKVEHIHQVLYNNIKLIQGKVKKPLKGIKVAVHYGCHALWPQAVKSDNPDQPTSLDELVKSLGATSAGYPGKYDCCGVPIAAFNIAESDRLLESKLVNAKANADCIVTPCPTCFLQFDRLSKEMKNNALPVFYVTELIGLGFGMTPEELSLNMHATSVQPVLDKLQINYEEGKKIDEVKKYFDYLDLISHCEACRLECTEAQMTKDAAKPFDPMALVDLLKEGKLEEAVENPLIWQCLQCGKCLNRCPNNIGMKDMFLKLREVAVQRGKAPEAVAMKVEMIKSTGYGMRPNEMVRKRLGMKPLVQANPDEIRRIVESGKK